MLSEYLAGGGELTIQGEFAENLRGEREAILAHPRTRRVAAADVEALVGRPPQVVVPAELDLATTVRPVEGGGSALHVVNYAYDADRDAVVVAPDCTLRVRLAEPHVRATVHRPGEPPAELPVGHEGGMHTCTLDQLGTYAIVHFQQAGEGPRQDGGAS